MARVRGAVLILVFGIPGILLCGLGMFFGTGFVRTGSRGFTVTAEFVAAALYLAGAVMSWVAATRIRNGPGWAEGRVLHSGVFMIPFFLPALALPLIFRRRSGDWIGAWTDVVFLLVITAGLLLPWLIGLRPQWPLVAKRQ